MKPDSLPIVSKDQSSLKHGILFSGTSGLVFEEANKKSFPRHFQNKSRLSYYASLFNSLEINSSFYKIPRIQTYAKWYEEVPEVFAFTVKLWRGITHVEKYQHTDLVKFMSAISGLGDKKACLLIQYPAGSKTGLQQRGNLLKDIQSLNNGWRLAVEIRNPDWLCDEYYQVLATYEAALVNHDMKNKDMLSVSSPSSFKYLRFHGPEPNYRGSYSEDFILAQAKRIRQWMNKNMDVYVYFNNTLGDALGNLKMLRQMIASSLL